MKTNRDAKDLAEAKDRVKRAKEYALAMPKFIHQGDLKFQTLDCQLQEVRRFNFPCCPQK